MSYSYGRDTTDGGSGSSGGGSAGGSGSDPFVTLTISPDTGLSFILDTMEATEELGRPFSIVLDVSAATPKNDLHAILGSSATVKLTYPGKDARYFNGIIARVQYRGLSGGGYRYRLELRPWIWLLSREQDCRIFQDKSPWTIMTTLFRDAGFTDFADKRQSQSGDTTLGYCVQYRETTLDFVTRLMEQYGIYYYVTHADGTHTVNFADDPNSHTALADSIPYRYDQTDWKAVDDHIWDWSADAQIQPGAFTYRNYVFPTPRADLTAKSMIPGEHTYGSSEVYDYPGIYSSLEIGQKAAQVRMQDLAARRQVYGGTSNSRKLGTGVKFTLSDFPDSAANQEYLVIESVCTVQRAETRAFQDEDEIIDTFRCVVRAVPGSCQFRLANITPRPLIRGPQPARVAGEQGQEITTDQYGRVKVKFPWDRRAEEDENSSPWLRVAQVWAGPGWGGLFIPRIGQEVIVQFAEGNPDRPVVIGALYNGDNQVPYTLPDNKTRSTVKSNSTLGGGGFNEFRFEDKKGEEEVYFHAQKDFNEVIVADHTEDIGGNTTSTVDKGNRSYTVKTGTDTLEVQSDRIVKLHANDTLTVDADRTTMISRNHELTVSGTSKTTVNGKVTRTLGDARETTIASSDKTDVGGKVIVTTGDDHTMTVNGRSTVNADSILLKCGESQIYMTTKSITISIGGSAITLDEDKLSIEGMQVTAEASMEMTVSAPSTKVAGETALVLDGGLEATLTGKIVMIN